MDFRVFSFDMHTRSCDDVRACKIGRAWLSGRCYLWTGEVVLDWTDSPFFVGILKSTIAYPLPTSLPPTGQGRLFAQWIAHKRMFHPSMIQIRRPFTAYPKLRRMKPTSREPL